MTLLSVNINKVALIRNSRGESQPNIVQFALDCEEFGAQGITIHPRPDERHIRYQDAYDLKKSIKTELNIEGYPSQKFIQLIKDVKPDQVTLVPDAPDALTSDAGWDTINRKVELTDIIQQLKPYCGRLSLFIDPIKERLEAAKECGTDRIEFYTGPYAADFSDDKETAVLKFKEASIIAKDLELGLNAGHDLNLDNLEFFNKNMTSLLEVSIGHALVCDALYYGIENVIQMYLRKLE